MVGKKTTREATKMKFIKTLTTITFLSAALAVRADDVKDSLRGFYLDANAGVNIMQPITATAGGMTGKLKTNPGERIGASVGYLVPLAAKTSIGLEFELGELVNTLDNVSGGGANGDLRGYYLQVPFLVNAVAVCHAVPNWAFYVGVGGGGVYSRLHVHRFDGMSIDSNADETDGAFQALGGVSYRIFDGGEVGLAYKYLRVFVSGTDAVGNHAVVGSFTWHF
jgi:opacity protein-like surface antigen